METKAAKNPKVKKVFICSPFSPRGETRDEILDDMSRNIKRAQKACRYATLKGMIPLAPHLYFTQFLHDTDEVEREYGQTVGLTWLAQCNELWIIGQRISSGMKKEIEKATDWNIPIRHFVERRTFEDVLEDIQNEIFGEN